MIRSPLSLVVVSLMLTGAGLTASDDSASKLPAIIEQEYRAYLAELVKAYREETAQFEAQLKRDAASMNTDTHTSAAIAALQARIKGGKHLSEFTALVIGQPGDGGELALTEWSQWRGPNRDGISPDTGLLHTLPTAGPPLVWKATGLGASYSSIAIAKGKIYTMGDLGDGSYVLCVDATTGTVLWTTRMGRPYKDGGPRCTPTVDGAQVFAIAPGGEVAALEAATGKELWHKSMKSDLGAKEDPSWGYSESPLVDGERVCVTPGGPKGTVAALNRHTGDLIWQTKEVRDRAHYASIVIASLCGVRQYVQLTGDSVLGIAPDTGKLLWKAARKGETAVIPTPVVKDDCVFVTSGYGVGCNLFRVTGSDGQQNATEVYANKDMCNHHGNVILLGDYVYGYSDTKGFVCMEFTTGKVMWSSKSVSKGSVAYAEGHIYLRAESDKGTVSMIRATPEAFMVDGKLDQPDRSKASSWAHPVISGGRLYLHDGDVLLCYDIKSK
jgi:outer membrane protein assembly factor BamB